MEKGYEKNIKPILDTFDKIREILRSEKIELPKIVVVGDQSSGKSSVLESITGVSLPRGENTVTKCPIILQMRNVATHSEEYASVRIEGEKNDERISLKDLNAKIEHTQAQLISKSKTEITEVPIYVSVNKIGSPDLTLYDLPGITYKNESLTTKIREIYTTYSAGKETLILLIIPANTDFTTSEAISIVRKNPDYKDRTIGIVTKIDLAVNLDKNLCRKIMYNELDLKFNPIVVRNRTQEELENKEAFEAVRQREIDLIESSDLMNLPDECKGTEQLILKLISIQREKLLSCKFEIKEKIFVRINKLRNDKLKLPLPAETITEKIDRFKECLAKLTNNFSNLVKGSDINHETIYNIGSRIREKFESFSGKFQKQYKRFFSDDFGKEVSKMISESRGLTLANFFDPSSFHSIISREIGRTHYQFYELVEICKDYIKDCLLHLCNEAFFAYPILNKAIHVEIKNSINDQTDKVCKTTQELLECEMDGEWTVNPYYMDMITKLTNKIQEKKESLKTVGAKKSEINSSIEVNDIKIYDDEIFTTSTLKAQNNDEVNVLQIQISCFAYWKVFEKRFIDYLNMIILRNLVYYYKNHLGLLLEKKFSPSSSTDNFISEEISITKQRHEIEESLKNLELAKEELSRIL